MRRLVALAAAAAWLLAPAQAAADGGVGFRPDPEGGGLDGGYLRITAAPGTTASGSFFMTNSGTTTASVRIYAADGLTGKTTGVVYGDEGARADGAWVTPSQTSASLAPKSEQRVTFSVRVPTNTLPGDHVASVVMQQRKGGGAITQVVRNVVPIHINVPGGVGPQIRLDKIAIGTLPGTSASAVMVTMRNDGNRMCWPRLSVALTGGRETGEAVTRQLDTILPGDAVPYAMPWPRALTTGTYRITVSASGCGTTQSDVVTGTTAPAADGVKPAVPTTTTPTRTTKRATAPVPSRSARVPGDQGAGGLGNRIVVTPVPAPADAGGSGAQRPTSPATTGTSQDEGGGLVDTVRNLLTDHGVDALQRASLPLAVLMMLGIAVVAQEALDRRDPKLALAPVHRDPDLAFDHDPVFSVQHPSSRPAPDRGMPPDADTEGRPVLSRTGASPPEPASPPHLDCPTGE